MGLTEYKKKRSFEDTPEPQGEKSAKRKAKKAAESLLFVVQKHDASRLHYDFRLELRGVLLSWAVPKGPSLNPMEKRLAMQVEDHPFDYKDFEGIIPEGNYGAGTVIVWDNGTYEPLEMAPSKPEQEKILLRDYQKGSMKFVLYGKKLLGEFALVKMKGREANSWLLIKHRDSFARTEDITLQDKSIFSGKTIEELAGDKTKKWSSNKPAGRVKSKTVKVAAKKIKRSGVSKKKNHR